MATISPDAGETHWQPPLYEIGALPHRYEDVEEQLITATEMLADGASAPFHKRDEVPSLFEETEEFTVGDYAFNSHRSIGEEVREIEGKVRDKELTAHEASSRVKSLRITTARQRVDNRVKRFGSLRANAQGASVLLSRIDEENPAASFRELEQSHPDQIADIKRRIADGVALGTTRRMDVKPPEWRALIKNSDSVMEYFNWVILTGDDDGARALIDIMKTNEQKRAEYWRNNEALFTEFQHTLGTSAVRAVATSK